MSTRHSLLIALLAVGLSLALIDQSGPARGSWEGAVATALGGAVWLISWLIRGVLWFIARTQQRPERASGNGLLAEVGVVLVACSLMWLNIPLKVRFALSEPALTRFAQDAVQAQREAVSGYQPVPPVYRNRLGLFPVRNVWSSAGGEVIVIVEQGFLSRGGFVFVPRDSPWYASSDNHIGEPIGHGWYHWAENDLW